MTLYPNPNDGTRLVIDLSAFRNNDSPIHIRITDLQGRSAVDSWMVPDDGSFQTKMNLEGLKVGVYLVLAENADGILASCRLLIQY